ncbi:MAG TPA: hypothetical protein VFR37_16745 [Longimicrobium sp.]|nr:hypothetical protein [Longimicrobium sp.]
MNVRGSLPGGAGLLGTPRNRLRVGAALIVPLVLLGAGVAWGLDRISRETEKRLSELRRGGEIGTLLESLILNQIAAGERYLVTPDPRLQRQYAEYGRRAHEQRRRYKELADLGTAEQQKIIAVEQAHQRLEMEYSLALAQLDVGDRDGALRRVAAARPQTQELRATLREIGALRAETVSAAEEEVRRERRRWEWILLLAALAAAALIYIAIRW